MTNQHSPGKRNPRKPFSVKLTTQERATLRAGAKALSESQGETMRAGGLERAARGLASGPNATNPTALVADDVRPWGSLFRCAYCPLLFVSEFDADAHIETAHPETP